MTESIDNDRLKAEFRLLRETEASAAPAYRQLLSGANKLRPAERWRLPAQLSAHRALLATSASAAVLVLAITMMTGHNESTIENAVFVPTAAPEADLIASFDMPTDFLLDTPWFELARTTPDFNLDIPQYDFPEEPSDEI